MKKFNSVFGSGTMRTGGSLVCNLLSVHKDIIILRNVFFHFFRHIYKEYGSISNKSNLYKLSGELSIRLKYRTNLLIDKKLFFSDLLRKKPKTYSDLYDCIVQTYLSQIPGKKIIGEYANGEWRKIGIFLNFNKKNIAFHILRDPRAVLSSWKKRTFSKGYKYLNAIFNWIDSADYAFKYKSKYGHKRFLLIKFEDVHSNPKSFSKKLCNFFGVKFDKNMIITRKWKNLLNSNFLSTNVSAYNNKTVYGFSKKRIVGWRDSLEDWEIDLIGYLCGSRMVKLGYKIYDKNFPLYKKGLNIMNKDLLLRKRLNFFLTNNRATDEKFNDVKDPKNWSANKKNVRVKFKNTPEYKSYKKEIQLIHLESKKIN